MLGYNLIFHNVRLDYLVYPRLDVIARLNLYCGHDLIFYCTTCVFNIHDLISLDDLIIIFEHDLSAAWCKYTKFSLNRTVDLLYYRVPLLNFSLFVHLLY